MPKIKIEVETDAPAIEGIVNVINGQLILPVFDRDGVAELGLPAGETALFFLHVRGPKETTVGLKISSNGKNLIRPRKYKIPTGGELGESVRFVA